MATENNKQVLNAPTLRFPEFAGEWERFRVSDILEFYPTNSLSWDQLDYETNKLYNLHYGLIHMGLPTLIDLTKSTLPSIKKEVTIQNYELCEEGDIAFADASEDTNEVAKVVEFVNTDNKQIVCGLHCIHGRDTKNKTITGFKGYAFSSAAFHNQIRNIAQGTKIYSINRSNFSECYISIPTKEEQTKIAKLLSMIDDRIATQSEAIGKLQSLIKSLAKKLTQSGEPNVRLSDCLECHTSTLQENDVYTKGDYPVYGATGVIGYTNDYRINGESILIIKDGSGVGTVKYADGKYSIIGTLNYLTPKENLILKYLYYALLALNFQPYKTGMAIPHIYFKDYGKAQIFCPSMESQIKIANLLFTIEQKLRLEQEVANQLSIQKSYLLQNMFI